MVVLALSIGCSGGTVVLDSASGDTEEPWYEWTEDTGGAADNTDSGKSDDSGWDEYDECGPEVVYGEACEGTWETTTCIDAGGEFWWCEGGSWNTGK